MFVKLLSINSLCEVLLYYCQKERQKNNKDFLPDNASFAQAESRLLKKG